MTLAEFPQKTSVCGNDSWPFDSWFPGTHFLPKNLLLSIAGESPHCCVPFCHMVAHLQHPHPQPKPRKPGLKCQGPRLLQSSSKSSMQTRQSLVYCLSSFKKVKPGVLRPMVNPQSPLHHLTLAGGASTPRGEMEIANTRCQ